MGMVELALVDYFVMGEAIGIVATFVVSLYYSRKRMQKLSTDIESKILNDLDDKMHHLSELAIAMRRDYLLVPTPSLGSRTGNKSGSRRPWRPRPYGAETG
jgi:hypothetical protein